MHADRRLAALVSANVNNLDKITVRSIADQAYAMGKCDGMAVKPESMLDGTFADIERRAIEYAYRECGRDMVETARRLGVGKTTLYRKLREYGVYKGRLCDKCHMEELRAR